MKYVVISMLLFFACETSCFSQTFELADNNNPLANGADLFLSGPPDTLQLITWLTISNLYPDTLRVMMKKEDIRLVTGASASICWAGYCYDPKIVVAEFSLSMPPGEAVSGCFGHFAPNGGKGVSIIRWTFFNATNPHDSVSITAHYSTYPAAIEDKTGGAFMLTYGGSNPANDHIVLKHSLPPGKPGRLELRSISGKLISCIENVSLSNTAVFDTRRLTSGMYFCSLFIDGKNVATLRTPIHH
jgi:hypothetical protein